MADDIEEILRKVKAALENKRHDFRVGFRRSITYLDIHSRPYFEKHMKRKDREKAIEILRDAYVHEQSLCQKLDADDERAKGYLIGLKYTIELLNEHIEFEPKPLFSELNRLLKEEMDI